MITNFNKEQVENKKNYLKLKEENENFHKHFEQTSQLTAFLENLKSRNNPLRKDSLQTTFQDLFDKYTAKGYKIPNLSVENNIFKQSPLLMENNKIKNLYKTQDNANDRENPSKTAKFLVKLSNTVIESLSQQKGAKEGYNFVTKLRRTPSWAALPNEENKTLKATVKENKQLDEYNKSITKLIRKTAKNRPIYQSENSKKVYSKLSTKTIGKLKEIPELDLHSPCLESIEEKGFGYYEGRIGSSMNVNPKLNLKNISSEKIKTNNSSADVDNSTNTVINDKNFTLVKNRFECHRPSIEQIKSDRSQLLQYAYEKITDRDFSNLNEIGASYLRNVKQMNNESIKLHFDSNADPRKLLNSIEEVKKKIEGYNYGEVFLNQYPLETNKRENAVKLIERVK